MSLGVNSTEEKGKVVFLNVAGGLLWDKTGVDKENKSYLVQEYTFNDEKKTRKGYAEKAMQGLVTGIKVNTHEKFGEFAIVEFDIEGKKVVLSVKTNTTNSQHLFGALLNMDATAPLYVKPYDFIAKAHPKFGAGGRRQGISFKQNDAPLNIKVSDAPWDKFEGVKDNAVMKKRFFEDLNIWYVEKINALSIKLFGESVEKESDEKAPSNETEKTVEKKAVATEKVVQSITPMKMKRFLRGYISENYENGETLPSDIKGDELKKWYDLAQAGEELVFSETESNLPEVSTENLASQLDDLLHKK